MPLIGSRSHALSRTSGRLVLLPGLVIVSVLFAFYGLSVSVHASAHHGPQAVEDAGTHDHDHPGTFDHGSGHCGASSACAPSFVADGPSAVTAVTLPGDAGLAGNDTPRRSPCLDRDPPVPRGGFSHI